MANQGEVPVRRSVGPLIALAVVATTACADVPATVSGAASPMAVHPGSAPSVEIVPIPVPDVVGLMFEPAVHRLRREGFILGRVFARVSVHPISSVVGQTPAAGSRREPRMRIDLVLSLGRVSGLGGNTIIQCRPEEDELDDPYCLGRLVRYADPG